MIATVVWYVQQTANKLFFNTSEEKTQCPHLTLS